MRKRVITPIPHGAPFFDQGWLDVGKAASVEVTSEDQIYPIECALSPGEKRGWRFRTRESAPNKVQVRQFYSIVAV